MPDFIMVQTQRTLKHPRQTERYPGGIACPDEFDLSDAVTHAGNGKYRLAGILEHRGGGVG